jgi:hypothetical protein
MSGHVDAESLALYAEGQLSRRRTVRVRAHLAGCAECARAAAALAEVTTRLSQVPVPPMPAAVAARLDAALSAESARRAAGAAPAPAPEPAGAPPPRPPRRGPLWSPRALRILAVTGATLVVAGGAGYAVSQFSGSGSSSSASSSSGTAPSPVPAAGRHSAVEGAPNVSSPGSRVIHPHTNPNAPSSGPRYVRTGTDYRHGTLAAQARHTLAEYTVSGLSGPAMLPASRVPAAVRSCVSHVAQGHPVRLVDLARYQQRPAIVIVLGQPDTVAVVSYPCHPLHSAPLRVTSGPTTG